ncbi:MAG: DUF3179 domain-containing (seleno)protein [Chitinophagaceae bacterium]
MKQIAVAILTLNPNQLGSSTVRIPLALRRAFLILVLLFLFAAELGRIYLLMPLPGSQVSETVDIAYWFDRHMLWIRLITLFIIGLVLINTMRNGRTWEKISLSLIVLAYVPLFYILNLRMAADHKFLQPGVKSFIPAAKSLDKSKLVIGVVINGEAKAYPIQLIGYHHQVADTVGNQPVFITYCTVCRTGRVYSSLLHGRNETFRLVGMDHYNAVFEDQTTKTWWQQASGKGIAGPLKGETLKEIPSTQTTIESWMRQYPNSVVMDGDPQFDEKYFGLEDYDKGTMQSSLVKRDYSPWQPKSWIVGVRNESSSKAFDWSYLVKKRVIQDSVDALPILVTMEADTTSFHVYDRRVNGLTLTFDAALENDHITDKITGSVWNMEGRCIEGAMKDTQLKSVQAYNEFWHAWERFEPKAKKYSLKE